MSNPSTGRDELERAAAANRAGDFATAQRLCREVLAREPRQPQALQLLGAIRAQQGALHEAEGLLRDAVARTEDAVALRNLCLLLRKVDRLAEAVPFAERWVAQAPGSAAPWAMLARSQRAAGDLAAADVAFARATALAGPDMRLLREHAEVLAQLGRVAESARLMEQSMAPQPDGASWNNLGRALHSLALHEALEGGAQARWPPAAERALAAYREAAKLKPTNAGPWCNLGGLAKHFGRLEEAERAFRHGLELAPDHAATAMNYGLLQLQLGRLEDGWKHFAARHAVAGSGSEHLPASRRWRGEALGRRSILLWQEQGYGDTIQFARYAPLLKAAGAARVGAGCPQELARLLRSAPGIDEVGTHVRLAQAYDCWAYWLDVPMHLGTTLDTVPAALPYLYPEPAAVKAWRSRLPRRGLRVGLAWKGSPKHGNDRHRSLPGLETLAPLWRVRGVHFVSLQKGAGEAEARTPPAGQPLVDTSGDIADFADSAALVSALDLVISVDTATVHLAGALGRPTWVLLPFIDTDWRWLLGRDDSPWYPGVMRLFRQPGPGEWAAVIDAVAARLASFVAQETRQLGR